MITNKTLPRAKTPEEVGVSSQKMHEFLQAVDRAGLELHSFMVLRHSKVAAECFRAPFTSEYRHQMWSVSKAFTSTALGLAVEEGFVSLDTPVADILKDYSPKKPDKRWPKLTLRHLATMTAGKAASFLSARGKNANWIQDYVNAPWYNEPGAEFRYINENMYIICAALARATGMSVMDYLTPRLFEPLGITDATWETDNLGIEYGGIGIYCKTEELAKLILCYLNEGMYEGCQVIPPAWTREAVRKHTDSKLYGECHKFGYGMGFWGNPDDVGGWRTHGVFTQYGIAWPEHDAVFVCNASTSEADELLDLVGEYIAPAFDDAAQPTSGSITGPIESPFEPPLRASLRSPLESQIDGRRICLRKNHLLSLAHFPVTALSAIVTMKNAWLPYQVNNIILRFGGQEASFYWREGPDVNEVTLGLDGSYRKSVMHIGGEEFIMLGAGEWINDTTFAVRLRAIETIACQQLTFTFHKNRVVMQPKSIPPMKEVATLFSQGAAGFFKNPFLLRIVRRLLHVLPRILEPKHRGKLMK